MLSLPLFVGLFAGALPSAWAGPQGQLTVLAGGRAAPESTILLPTAWEGNIEPAGLAAVDGGLRLGAVDGAWVTLGAGTWAYLPEGEALSVDGRGALGWSGAASERLMLDVAAKVEAEWYPLFQAGFNGRTEVLGRARYTGSGWSLTPSLTAVDRRYLDQPAASFSYGEAGLVLGLSGDGPLALELGLAGQGNQSQGLGSEGAVGAQLRGLSCLSVTSGAWHGGLEYRLTVALEGEVEHELRPLFTPWSDYSDDADALSGGGFVQHRVRLWGALSLSRWTLSAGAMGRQRQAGDDELAVSYKQSGQLRLEADRELSEALVAFGAVGAASAGTPSGPGYMDGWGWLGLRWRLGSG